MVDPRAYMVKMLVSLKSSTDPRYIWFTDSKTVLRSIREWGKRNHWLLTHQVLEISNWETRIHFPPFPIFPILVSPSGNCEGIAQKWLQTGVLLFLFVANKRYFQEFRFHLFLRWSVRYDGETGTAMNLSTFPLLEPWNIFKYSTVQINPGIYLQSFEVEMSETKWNVIHLGKRQIQVN